MLYMDWTLVSYLLTRKGCMGINQNSIMRKHFVSLGTDSLQSLMDFSHKSLVTLHMFLTLRNYFWAIGIKLIEC